jgi:hypothetical protein
MNIKIKKYITILAFILMTIVLFSACSNNINDLPVAGPGQRYFDSKTTKIQPRPDNGDLIILTSRSLTEFTNLFDFMFYLGDYTPSDGVPLQPSQLMCRQEGIVAKIEVAGPSERTEPYIGGASEAAMNTPVRLKDIYFKANKVDLEVNDVVLLEEKYFYPNEDNPYLLEQFGDDTAITRLGWIPLEASNEYIFIGCYEQIENHPESERDVDVLLSKSGYLAIYNLSVENFDTSGWNTIPGAPSPGNYAEILAEVKEMFGNNQHPVLTEEEDLQYFIEPEDSTSANDTTASPDETTTAPTDTTGLPDDTTAAPTGNETPTPTDDTTTVPEDTTTAPEEATTVPEEETSAPEEETTASEEETPIIE